MRWDRNEILADLQSGQPARIEAGLRDLKRTMSEGYAFEMAPIGPEIFEPAAASVTEAMQLAYLDVITHYNSFVPPLTQDQVISRMISLLLHYGTNYVAYQVAMELKISGDTVAAVREAMQEIVRQRLNSAHSIQAAEALVSRLLDGKDPVRHATVQELAAWPDTVPFQRVKEAILPELDELERLQLTRKAS